jgi:hypothetical protein
MHEMQLDRGPFETALVQVRALDRNRFFLKFTKTYLVGHAESMA